ncbi:regulatory protein [Marichromatium purpuratum 984]|uniref:Regulatory protein n=1 Tax=Marichromatium purpuratum 984 TaxID=765910 RepID=W0DXS7_MARPU|nr:regulatory protein [Marichromatium purpuratum 984]
MDANTVIDALGGTAATAKLCKVRPPSVSGWRKNGIPEYRLDYLRLARPEVFRSLGDPTQTPRAAA